MLVGLNALKVLPVLHAMNLRKRPTFALVYSVVLALALFMTFGREPNGLDVNIDGSARAQAAKQRESYDLSRLSALQRTVFEVKSRYVEPDRIDYKRMLLGGLTSLQRVVAPVIIRFDEGDDFLTVQVNELKRQFKVSDVTSPWTLTERFREIFEFLQPELVKEPDLKLRDVEYATINGMLRTLDPHTVLLSPDIFKDMQASTSGHFGGLGIVISIRDGHLTVIRPIENTPASRAGLQKGDRIVQIENESTLNMELTEAVDRLRGEEGSTVDVWISRRQPNGTYAKKKRFQLTRAIIRIDSVSHRMLGSGIGYVKISNFQGNTTADLREALSKLHEQNMKALVLDLRDNPGGLLDQAVKVADAFLASGTIVATSSQDPRERDSKEAHERGTEANYPMVVLISGSSASASEIVAGALQNHDRALVVGQRSFGKGSVQVLFNLQDGSALKLTVAQYLTPGDVSIQGVGIVPDIAIEPMTVDLERMDLMVDDTAFREADLRAHLTHAAALIPTESSVILRYYLDSETRRRIQEAAPEEAEENEDEVEFLTDFSVRLLSRATSADRRRMLQESGPVIDAAREKELTRAVAELRKVGVDWSEGANGGKTSVAVEAFTDRPDNRVVAGEPIKLTVRVKNIGEAPLYRLRAVTKSENRLFSERELVFGKLMPGETREWTSPLGICTNEDGKRICRIPRGTPARADGIEVRFEDEHGNAPPPVYVRTTIDPLPRPNFAWSLHFGDDHEGNGDGRLQRGERGNLYLRVKNIGDGPAHKTVATLRSHSGKGLLLHEGRFEIDSLAPSEERVVRFGFEVLREFQQNQVKLEASVYDTELRQGFTQEKKIAIAPSNDAPPKRVRRVQIAPGTAILELPTPSSSVVARAPQGATVESVREIGGFLQLRLANGQPGWVPSDAVTSGAESGPLEYVIENLPPQVRLHVESLVTRDDRITLRGRASDDVGVRDVYVFAGANKVFYESFGNGRRERQVEFKANVPLHQGINYVTVVAREHGDAVAQELLVIRRDGPNGEILESPRYDDELFGLNMNLDD
jgi:carboxyl-terminal processing protease